MQRITGLLTRKWGRALALGLVTSLLWIALAWVGVLHSPEWKLLDLHFLVRGPERGLPDIVVVGVDDQSLAEVGRWPWPRSVHAQLVHKLNELGAALIGVDILLAEPHDTDEQLATVMSEGGNVVLASKFESVSEMGYRTQYLVRPTPLLRNAALAEGFINFPIDSDAFLRRFHISATHQDQSHLSFPAMLAVLLGRPLPGHAERLADGSYLINYAGGPRSFPTYSYYQVLNDMLPAEWIQDRVVLVGATAPDLRDVFPTPFVTGGLTPGVEVHANALSTLLQETFIVPVPPALGHALTVAVTVIVGIGVAGLSPLWAALLLLVVLGGLLGVGFVLFTNGLWLPLVAPLGSVLTVIVGTALIQYVTEEREKRRIRSIFGRFVSENVVNDILDSKDELALGGKRQTITILFSDIRGFTPLSEILPPEEVVGLLNEYFGAMTKIIFRQGGTVDKFMGDCIMALFGAPLPLEDHAERAVEAAVAMRQELAILQEKWSGLGQVSLQAGIGVNTGEVVIGNIGSAERMEYTAIGDAVNLAARLESLTRQYPCEILVGEDTFERVASKVDAIELSQVEVKGKAQPVTVFGITDWKGEASASKADTR